MKISIGWTIYSLMTLAGIMLIYKGLSEHHIFLASPELIGGIFLYWIGRDIWKNLS